MSQRKLVIRPVLKIFWRHSARYKLALFLSLFFTASVSVGGIIIPLYYKRLFDVLASAAVPTNAVAEILFSILFSILILQFISWLARRIGQFANVYLQPRVMRDLTQTAFTYLLGHSYTFFVNNFAGSLVRKINRLSRAFEQFADRVTYDLLPLVVSLTGILIVLFYRSFWLGAVFLIWVIILMTIQFIIARWKLKYNILTAEKDSEMTGVLSDSVTNDTTVKLFTGIKEELSIFQCVVDSLMHLRLTTWRLDELVNMIQGLFMIGIEIVLIYLGIIFWRDGLITIGDFALIQAYLINAFDKLWNLGGVIRHMYEAFADATEMVEIMNRPHEIINKPNAPRLKVSLGQVEFREVIFSFRQTRAVLKDFNLLINSREKVALVGPSGAGKTTIIKLLFRFFDVESGGVYVDQQNISAVTQESLREAISLVPQEPILFHRSLMENIRYGKRGATDEEVIEAAKKAHCYEFISQYPEGFNTYVGERGVKLSGGERQRVAIARAILKNAPILVLDEATSSLDSESEALIQDALRQLMEGKTVIVIAHRLSTIMKMDRIVVVEDGQVVSTGTHQELLSHTGGLYKKLWEIQAGGFLA
jgi:ATP-binding cassette subfamily B protein